MLDEEKKPEIVTYYNETKSGADVLDKLVRTLSNVRHRWMSRSFSTCWTLLNTMWITFDPNWQQGKPHRRRLFLHELATQLLHGHASARFRTPKFLEVTKRRRTQKCVRRSGIFTAATGMSSSLVDVTATLRIDVDDATCARERKSGRRENATHSVTFCKQHSCVLTACLTCAEGGDERPRYQ